MIHWLMLEGKKVENIRCTGKKRRKKALLQNTHILILYQTSKLPHAKPRMVKEEGGKQTSGCYCDNEWLNKIYWQVTFLFFCFQQWEKVQVFSFKYCWHGHSLSHIHTHVQTSTTKVVCLILLKYYFILNNNFFIHISCADLTALLVCHIMCCVNALFLVFVWVCICMYLSVLVWVI